MMILSLVLRIRERISSTEDTAQWLSTQYHQKQHLLCPLSTARNRGNQVIFPLKLVFDCLIRTDQKLRKPSSKMGSAYCSHVQKGIQLVSTGGAQNGLTALGGYRLSLSMFEHTMLSLCNLGNLSNI